MARLPLPDGRPAAPRDTKDVLCCGTLPQKVTRTCVRSRGTRGKLNWIWHFASNVVSAQEGWAFPCQSARVDLLLILGTLQRHEAVLGPMASMRGSGQFHRNSHFLRHAGERRRSHSGCPSPSPIRERSRAHVRRPVCMLRSSKG